MTRIGTEVSREGQGKDLESIGQEEQVRHRCEDPRPRKETEVRPQDVLTTEQMELLERANRGAAPCPWCGLPLKGAFIYYDLEDDDCYAGVRLSCQCGFVEY